MKANMIQITMSVSNDCYIAMEFLRKKENITFKISS